MAARCCRHDEACWWQAAACRSKWGCRTDSVLPVAEFTSHPPTVPADRPGGHYACGVTRRAVGAAGPQQGDAAGHADCAERVCGPGKSGATGRFGAGQGWARAPHAMLTALSGFLDQASGCASHMMQTCVPSWAWHAAAEGLMYHPRCRLHASIHCSVPRPHARCMPMSLPPRCFPCRARRSRRQCGVRHGRRLGCRWLRLTLWARNPGLWVRPACCCCCSGSHGFAVARSNRGSGMALCGMTCHGMAAAWHDVLWMAWHGMTCHGMAWHGMAWHGRRMAWC